MLSHGCVSGVYYREIITDAVSNWSPGTCLPSVLFRQLSWLFLLLSLVQVLICGRDESSDLSTCWPVYFLALLVRAQKRAGTFEVQLFCKHRPEIEK